MATRPGFFAGALLGAGWQGNYSAASIKNIPAWFCCAQDDQAGQLPNIRVAVQTLRMAGGNPIYSEFATGGHGTSGTANAPQLINEMLLSSVARPPPTSHSSPSRVPPVNQSCQLARQISALPVRPLNWRQYTVAARPLEPNLILRSDTTCPKMIPLGGRMGP